MQIPKIRLGTRIPVVGCLSRVEITGISHTVSNKIEIMGLKDLNTVEFEMLCCLHVLFLNCKISSVMHLFNSLMGVRLFSFSHTVGN